ncbi:hypothetical protein TRICI_006494 [Trichomonascus ciferrii]|uniref:Zn(2)-C6 fungal-type domain-containing protein n=1 Tax=Trichomonascus ciferrii TaxID=44093 RepID=A0A642UNI2_9ASCO|nr:hypothetical protein TRICI_006494 [Trichomonascus ciferrii]
MIRAPGGQNGSRIAQACDRCRSKKIKCDGKRPSCSQCLSVGFECKITDKLTRRAFPRGYTESLEDRVRQLESENQKLMDLLDLKDEQMDLLSKVHNTSNQKQPPTAAAVEAEQPAVAAVKREPSETATTAGSPDEGEEESYLVKHTNTLCLDGTFKGSSTGAIFVEALLEKLGQKAPNAVFAIQNAFFHNKGAHEAAANSPRTNTKNHSYSLPNLFPVSPPPSVTSPTTDGFSKSPAGTSVTPPLSSASSFSSLNLCSRVLCDKLLTTYFQEWHSTFSILDQDNFVSQYQKYMGNDACDFSENPTFAIQLIMVLNLAALGSKDPSVHHEIKALDDWKPLFSSALQTKPGLDTLQALCLTLLYSLHVGNTSDVWHFRAVSVNMAYRLGLHRPPSTLRHHDGSQLSGPEATTRTKLFWTVYALDAASSVAVGSPRLCHDSCISTPMPDLTEDGTEFTACHLRIITFSQILAGIIDTIYSFNASKDYYSYKTVIKFEDQLESWKRELEPELKFEFANGAPASSCSLKPVHQKSPLFLMLYHWARILIHMPAVSPVHSDSSTKGSGATVAIMQSAKVFSQVFNYLHARKVVTTLFFNPSSVMLHLSSIILYSAVDYSRGGALLQETKSIVTNSLDYLHGQIQAERPGCLPITCYQWFEQACDIVLRTSKDSSSSNGGRRRSSSKKQQQQQPTVVKPEPQQGVFNTPAPSTCTPAPPTEHKSINIPHTDVDEMLKSMGFDSAMMDEQQRKHSEPILHHTTCAPAQTTFSAVAHDQPLDMNTNTNVDDYLDFWSPVDYLSICKDNFAS